jgi:hypothetical protein
MPRKCHVVTSVAAVLATLAVLALAMPNERDGLAHAGENGRHADDDSDRMQDHRSLVLSGQLVRIADVNSASCERKLSVNATALGAEIKGQNVHLARMAAEFRGLEEIVLPEGLQSQQNDGPVAAALRDERVAFAARKEALTSQIASLNQAKELEEREIEFTQATETALGRQGALLQ